jgi:predicted  nucleic acid-binding Zn-ribbon protein
MNTETLNTDVQHAITKLQTLRDEIRMRLHLGSLDLQQQWDKLDPEVAAVEKLSHDASETVKEKAHALVVKLGDLRASLADK